MCPSIMLKCQRRPSARVGSNDGIDRLEGLSGGVGGVGGDGGDDRDIHSLPNLFRPFSNRPN